MPNIDDNAKVGLELMITTGKFTAELLIAVMEHFLNEREKDKHKSAYQDLSTTQGKQKVRDLFEKHQNSGIETLENNLSKVEVKNIQKQLKSMGIDFSIHKIDKDQFSLFFAGKDREAIEKGISNAVEKFKIKKNKTQDLKEKVKPLFNIDKLNKRWQEKNKEKKKIKNKTQNRSL